MTIFSEDSLPWRNALAILRGMDTSLLEVEVVDVKVGELTLKLRTPSLAKQKAVAKAMASIDPKPFFAAAETIVGQIGADFLSSLVKAGPELYRTGIQLLGDIAGVGLGDLCAVVLDTEANFNLLKTNGQVADADAERDDRSRYRSCERFRARIVEEITLAQALNVFEHLARMGDYKALVGKILAGLKLGSSPAEKTPMRSEKPEIDLSPESPGGLQA